MIKEAIILAGGLGTRLRTAVPDLPKCMAPVSGKPFLFFVIDHLQKQGVNKFIFSLGYKSEIIIDYTKSQYPKINIQYSIEDTPLGTGGAIKLAASKATEKNVLVVNGDTLFAVNIEQLAVLHEATDADCTLCLKPMKNFERYGVVELNSNAAVASFKEKQFYKTGLINGGVYALNTKKFLQEALPEKCSFEKDYLEQYYTKRSIFGIVQDAYFIDIGIPEDYEKAQKELKPL